MADRQIKVFYAWQSDRDRKFHKDFIWKALNDAAERITNDKSSGVEVLIDADTQGITGTPPVSATILEKIDGSDVFISDLTFVAQTKEGKLIPNPNVMIEHGYALRALTFERLMPVMNIHYGPAEKLPFDMGHVRHPTKYNIEPGTADAPRREARSKLSDQLEKHLRLMIEGILRSPLTVDLFMPQQAVRPPAFFFDATNVLAAFGEPGEQECRFKRDRAIFLRLYPKYSDQPRVGRAKAVKMIPKLLPFKKVFSSITTQNDWGAISVEPHGDGITNFTQLFESGELWAASEEPFREGKPPDLIPIRVEKILMACLENYLSFYESALQMKPPLVLQIGATGLKGRYLYVPSKEFSSGETVGSIRKNTHEYNTVLPSYEPQYWQDAIREFAIGLYDLGAIERSSILTPELIAANGLPS